VIRLTDADLLPFQYATSTSTPCGGR
jgi:hypothetical protein